MQGRIQMYIKDSFKIPLEELMELESRLPYGTKKEIRDRTGLSRTSVDDVFKGKFFNEPVIDIAIEITRRSIKNTTKKRKEIAVATASNG